MYTVGVDIGGTNLRIGLVSNETRLSCFEMVPQAEILKGNAPGRFADFIKQYIGRQGAEDRIAAVCAAFPAAIDKDRAVILNAPNIAGFNGVNIKSVLSESLGYPVYIEKDVNALFFYDLYLNQIASEGVVIAVYVGTGLGNAVMMDGRLLTGENGVAGELGHIPAWDNEEPCTCGNTGCVETFVGGKHLDYLRQTEFPRTFVGQLFEKHGNHPMLDRYIRRLAAVISAEINILDPKVVILGGGVISMKDFPKDILTSYIRRYARKPLPEANLKFIFSENNGENGVIGAGIFAWEQIKNGC